MEICLCALSCGVNYERISSWGGALYAFIPGPRGSPQGWRGGGGGWRGVSGRGAGGGSLGGGGGGGAGVGGVGEWLVAGPARGWRGALSIRYTQILCIPSHTMKGQNTCQWLVIGSVLRCGKSCLGEHCTIHLARLRQGPGTQPCTGCGKGVKTDSSCVRIVDITEHKCASGIMTIGLSLLSLSV